MILQMLQLTISQPCRVNSSSNSRISSKVCKKQTASATNQKGFAYTSYTLINISQSLQNWHVKLAMSQEILKLSMHSQRAQSINHGRCPETPTPPYLCRTQTESHRKHPILCSYQQHHQKPQPQCRSILWRSIQRVSNPEHRTKISLLLVEQQPRKLPIETSYYGQTTMSFVKVEGASVRLFEWVFIMYPDITVSGFSGLSGILEIGQIAEILACTYHGTKIVDSSLSSLEKSSQKF